MQNAVQQKPEIRKIMEKECAIKILNEIKDLIGGTDLTSICGDELDVKPNEAQEITIKRVIQAIQCGLVYWDEQENCLIQNLIHPLKSGELTADKLHYRHRLNIKELKGIKATSEIEYLERILSQLTGRSSHLIGSMRGQDIEIGAGCVSFFGQ